MQIFLFFALFIAILAIIFAVQNNDPVQVSFIKWDFDGSLALVLLIAMAAGALISFFASLPTNIKVRWALRNQKKKLAELEASLAEHKQKLEEMQKTPEKAAPPQGSEAEKPKTEAPKRQSIE
ncbi:MAG: LapA family protein [Anaerolineales bacterium]|nr:LapA family protein [Anaerolineales bacterium]